MKSLLIILAFLCAFSFSYAERPDFIWEKEISLGDSASWVYAPEKLSNGNFIIPYKNKIDSISIKFGFAVYRKKRQKQIIFGYVRA